MKFEADRENQKVPKIVAGLIDKSGVAYKLQELVWGTVRKVVGSEGNFLENIEWFWNNIKSQNFIEEKVELPVGKLGNETAKIISAKERIVWLRGITFAKIRGWRGKEGFEGHPEIDRRYFRAIPWVIYCPEHVIRHTKKGRYLLVGQLEKRLVLVVEVGTKGDKNWLVTAFIARERYLGKKEKICLKHKTGYPAGTAVPPILAPAKRGGGSRFSTLQDTRVFYNTLRRKCQEEILSYSKFNLRIGDIHIEHPANPEHGDYSSNIAMVIFSKTKNEKPKIKNTNSKTKKLYKYKNPLDLAKEISKAISYLDEVKVAPPGFINFWLSKDFLLNALAEPVKLKKEYGSSQILKGKKIFLEHTSPNPQTTIMVGHLRNNFLGMTTARMLGTIGAKVIKDCIVNDRGVHICRALFGYLVFAKKDSGLSGEELKNFKKISGKKIKEIVAKVDWKKMIEEWIKNKSDWWAPADLRLKSDHFNLVSYVLGSRAHSLSKKVKSQVNEILLAWEAEDENVWKLWRKILQDWSALGYQETYRRIGSVHDWVWYESDHYKMGKEIVEMGLKKRVFKKSQGAIVSNLSDYSLSDAVLIKSDGSALYHTQDLALTKLKQEKFPSDLYIWDIGVEQTLYLKQLFAMCEQLGFGKLGDYFHLSYELINLKAGRKMSTREGTVIPADELLDELHNKARKIIETSDQELRGELSEKQKGEIAEKVGLAAAKYGMLRYSRETTIYFDIDESLSLEGNSGPYLQYTYARARSVLRKADKFHLGGVHLATSEVGGFNEEEMALLRTVYQFPEVVLESAKNFAPDLICNFLFDLAQKFNTFYNRWPILEPERAKDTSDGGRLKRSGSHDSSEVEAIRNFRLLLTASVAQVLKNGLGLLGIEVLEKM